MSANCCSDEQTLSAPSYGSDRPPAPIHLTAAVDPTLTAVVFLVGFCFFSDGRRGLAAAAETPGGPGAGAGAEERHH